MRNGFVGGASAVAVVATVMAATPAVDGQGRDRTMRWMPEMMLLQNGGSEIGVLVRDLTGDEIARAKLAPPGGVLVQEVHEDSAASRAGLMEGDIVVEFDGERVRGARHFTRLVRETPPGRAVTSSIVRAGSRRDLEITPQAGDRLSGFPDVRQLEQRLRALPELRDRSQSPGDLDPTPDLQVTPRGQIGITLAPLTAQLATYFGVKEGVLVSSVRTDSAAAQAGMRAGDVITAVNGRPAQNVADVTRAVRAAKPGSELDLRVFRDNKEITLKVLVPELISEPRSILPV